MSGSARADVRRRRAAAVAIVLIATLAATLAAFRPSLSPPGLSERMSAPALAKGQFLVDRPVSVLLTIDVDASAPGALALTYVQYLRADHARLAIARAVGVPPRSLQIDGPFTTLLGRETVRAREPIERPQGRRALRLVLDVTPNRPVVTMIAAAPQPLLAVKLVDSAFEYLREQVDAARAVSAPDAGDTAALRTLGPTVSQTTRPPQTIALFVLVFLVVVAIGAAVIGRSARRSKPRPRDILPPQARDDDWPHTSRPLPWALAAFMTMIWLVPFAAVSIPGKLDRIALAGLAVVWAVTIAGAARRGVSRARVGMIHGAAAALFVVCAISVLVNADTLANLDELGGSVKKVTLLASMLAFFVIASSALRPAEVSRVVSLMLGLASIVAVGTLVEYRLGTNVFYDVTSLLSGGRVSLPSAEPDSIGRKTIYGPTVHPLELATMLGMALAFAAVRLLDAPDRRRRLGHAALCGLLLAGALATVRKTSVVAPVAGLLVVAAYRPREIARQLLPLTVGMVVLVHVLAPGTLGSVFSQLEPEYATSTLSTRDRAADYTGIAPDVGRHLVVGRGYGSYDPAKYRILDNQYLGLVVEVGVAGLVAYLLLFASVLARTHRLARSRDRLRGPPGLGAGAAVMVVAMASALFDVLSFPHVVYMLFLVCGLLATLDARERLPVPPGPIRPGTPGARAAGTQDQPRPALTRAT